MSIRSTDHSDDHNAWCSTTPTSDTAATEGDVDRGNHDDRGATLVEMLIVVLMLGTLLGAAVLALGGLTTEAADTGCDADRRQLHVAVGAYQAQTGNDTIAPTPAEATDGDRYERTLVDRGFLRVVSEFHHVDDLGAVTTQESTSC